MVEQLQLAFQWSHKRSGEEIWWVDYQMDRVCTHIAALMITIQTTWVMIRALNKESKSEERHPR